MYQKSDISWYLYDNLFILSDWLLKKIIMTMKQQGKTQTSDYFELPSPLTLVLGKDIDL